MKNFLLAPKILFCSMIFAVMAVCLSVVGVSWAYFAKSVESNAEYQVVSPSSKVFESTLSGSAVTVGSEYTQSSTISAGSSKTLTIQNTTDFQTANQTSNKVLLRVSFCVKSGNENVSTYTFTPIDASVYQTVAGKQNAGFTAIENGYYYYNAPMLKDDYAPFGTFSNTGSSAVHISLNIEVVQASLDVATNYWNYRTGNNQSSNLLSSRKTVDGVSISNANGLVVMVPNGANWRQAIDSDDLDSNYTSGSSSVSISTLTGAAGNCMRIYNNSVTPIILALRMQVSLYEGNNPSTEWSSIGLFKDLSLKFNFKNDTNNDWIDIRDNATPHTFDVSSTGKYISFLYNKIVYPGQSVYALTNTIDVTNPVNQTGFKFRIVCEVLGYDASESSYVDSYLALTTDSTGVGGNGITTGDRVPLFYDYSTTDTTKNTYTTQLDSNGRYTGRANFYSQYAKWFDLISPSLT